MAEETQLKEEAAELEGSMEEIKQKMENLEEKAKDFRDYQFSKYVEEAEFTGKDIDKEKFKEFMQDFSLVFEGDEEDEYYIYVPKFIPFQVGQMVDDDGEYKIFEVSTVTKAMTGIPDWLQEKGVDLDDEEIFRIEGDLLEFEEEGKELVKEDDISQHLEDVKDDKATIQTGSEFNVIQKLIERGHFPFKADSVDEEDLRETDVNFELRSYQEDGVQKVHQEGSACFCWMTGAGKSFPAMYFLDELKYSEEDGRKAVVVHGDATRDQWEQYFEDYAPRLKDEVEIYTYAGLHNLEENAEKHDYACIVFDECHSLPADTFSRGALIPTKYRLGLSASPYREDDRESYIFALTGNPIGLDWEKTLEILNRTYHEVNVHVTKDRDSKIQRADKILEDLGDKKTLIFVDHLDFGERLAARWDLKFISGKDTCKMDKARRGLKEDGKVIVSRAFDHGVSFDGLQAIIEMDFLFGSKRQQIQRTGRLFHSDEAERHDILFTKGEFSKHDKRLYGMVEKGFQLNMVDDVEMDVPEKMTSGVTTDIELEIDKDASETTEVRTKQFNKRFDDPVEMLKDEDVKDLIEKLLEEDDVTLTEDKKKKALIAIAQDNGELQHSDIEDLLDISRGSQATKAWRKGDPSLVRKEEGKLYIRVEEINDVLEEMEEKKEKKKKVEEVKEELGL